MVYLLPVLVKVFCFNVCIMRTLICFTAYRLIYFVSVLVRAFLCKYVHHVLFPAITSMGWVAWVGWGRWAGVWCELVVCRCLLVRLFVRSFARWSVRLSVRSLLGLFVCLLACLLIVSCVFSLLLRVYVFACVFSFVCVFVCWCACCVYLFVYLRRGCLCVCCSCVLANVFVCCVGCLFGSLVC